MYCKEKDINEMLLIKNIVNVMLYFYERCYCVDKYFVKSVMNFVRLLHQ